MTIAKIYAQLSCRSLAQGTAWFANIFGRGPDARPMEGLAEWHHEDHAGFQLFQNPDDAGHGTLTLFVRDLAEVHNQLCDLGLNPPGIERGDSVTIVRLRDPDSNLVVLAQPRHA
ncbi:VOC family protein [Oceaniglobus trochenteri]|uniref:VOC family protein n=1 Tax=Oceaniglobus trochenteri TaxID=2763260 RepID=UPI001D000BCB|nr:hypothetical protein [Oceaniglobus trochenteri]